jgi:hypothetical protein
VFFENRYNVRKIDDKKITIVVECAKYHDTITEKLVRGAIPAILAQFTPISRRSIISYYGEFKRQQANGVLAPNLSPKRKGRCGPANTLTDKLRNEYNSIGQEYSNLRLKLTDRRLKEELATAGFALARSTIQDHLKQQKTTIRNVRIKPLLTAEHKKRRRMFILDQANRDHGLDRPEHHYRNQFHAVHVDESWFYLQNVYYKVVVWEGIKIPDVPVTRHKSHIVKVMFLVAVGRSQTGPSLMGKSAYGLALKKLHCLGI